VGLAISNVERLSYSAENLAAAKATGRTYEYDTNYIYLERAAAVSSEITLDGAYTVSDHGIEYFLTTTVPVYAGVLYGNNLKNKLEVDVLTKSEDLVNNLVTNDSTKALSAAQGYALNSKLAQTVTITPESGVAVLNSSLIQVGGAVVGYLQLRKSSTTTGSWVKLATVSVPPKMDVEFPMINAGDVTFRGAIAIFTTGEVKVYCSGGDTFCCGVSYVV
jgi:hypothetical protein